ncbi:MAG: glycoside hydrolase family 95 protein [Saccharofermentanales bacterium]
MSNNNDEFWFAKTADRWIEALPIGNGRMGAMIFGGINVEQLSLNESTVWSGKEYPGNDNPEGPEYLAKIQDALLPPRDSDDVLNVLLDKYQGRMENFGTSRPFGDMFIKFGNNDEEISGYRRSLDISTGIAVIEFTSGGIKYKREIFASYPAQVIVMKISSSTRGAIDFGIEIKPVPYNGGCGSTETAGNYLLYDGQVFDGGMKTHAKLVVIDGNDNLIFKKNNFIETDSNEVIIYLSMATTFLGNDPVIQCNRSISEALKKGYEQLKCEHILDFSRQFNRLEISLGDENRSDLPIDARLAAVKDGYADSGLDRILYQFARYLTISASREDSPLPMHLQGIWNDNLAANMCWTCDYHLDINSQMNQWISTPGNLPQSNISLGNYIKNILMPSGKRTARVQYGKNGWVAHTVTNAWGYSSFINAIWSIFPSGGAWIASSLWDQYEFFQDEEFLKNIAYPVLKEAAEFFLDFLITYPGTGHLVTAPSCSPENGSVSIMPTSDRIIIYGLFDSVIKASGILGIDKDFREKTEEALSKLPPIEICRHGQIKEWYEDDTTDGITGHRHFSHLLALFPYDQITMEETPDLIKAAEISMDRRTRTEGWEETEFTGANLAAFYARMKNGNKAYERINIVKRKLTSDNLMTMSPAGIAGAETDIFIIDGNMGIAAAMSEMLLQSYKGRLELLPALPDIWRNGHIKGIAGRGGFEIEMTWENFILKNAEILSNIGNICILVKNKALNYGKFDIFKIEGNEKSFAEITFKDDKIISFKTEKGQKYKIVISGEIS